MRNHLASAFVTALLTAATLLPMPALAHHILGLPHYKYDESYPQIPYVEVQAQTLAHALTFTYLPGTPEPGERVRFKLYVQELATRKPARAPLEAQFFRKHFWGADEAVGEPFALEVGTGPEGNDYKFFETFPTHDAYELRLKFPEGETVEVMPFPVQVGRTDDRPLLFGAVGLLLFTIVAVRVVKSRRTRLSPKGGAPNQPEVEPTAGKKAA